jgi:hypothetical protein
MDNHRFQIRDKIADTGKIFRYVFRTFGKPIVLRSNRNGRAHGATPAGKTADAIYRYSEHMRITH